MCPLHIFCLGAAIAQVFVRYDNTNSTCITWQCLMSWSNGHSSLFSIEVSSTVNFCLLVCNHLLFNLKRENDADPIQCEALRTIDVHYLMV